MIEELYVRGIGGISSAELIFNGNFIVITGESGAGKSSLVRSFEFISGRRSHSSMIRASFDEASVDAVWGETREGERLITKRTLTRSGKGRVLIQGSPATAGQLAEITSSMIEIQSQFSQLDLLDEDKQLDLVDLRGGGDLLELKQRLGEVFPGALAAERRVLAIKNRRSELAAEMDKAPGIVRAIKALSLYSGCEDEWAEELARCERGIEEASRYETIVERMTGGGENLGLADQLASLVKELYEAAPEDSRERWEELGERALSAAQELFAAARDELGIVSVNELETLRDETEVKIGAVRKLKRELNARSADDLLAYINETEEKMKWMEESMAALEEAQTEAARLRAEAAELAKSLRAAREEAASDFGAAVRRHLTDLAMEDASFAVEIEKLPKVRASGAEAASFTMAWKGSAPNPVNKVASGGELSRILIAIQAAMQESMDRGRLPGAIVFDEVEAGLGGRAALLAGQKLRGMSRYCRIILITHDASIAAMADQHFIVVRHGDETEVFETEGEARVAEIARMLSGDVSEEAREHARALLKSNERKTIYLGA